MATLNPKVQAALDAARARREAQKLLESQALGSISQERQWNPEQQEAIKRGIEGESFVLIGAAGTGKTTTLRGMIESMLSRHLLPMLECSTKHLIRGNPGIVLTSFTRRATRNIARQMPKELRASCINLHKLLEFGPEQYETENDAGETVTRTRFVPYKNKLNKLPNNLRTIVIDEASMVDTDLFQLLIDALPDPAGTQFVFLGDLNQLPPVYGYPILGFKLLDLPIVQLVRVYRQALESPIISLATAVRTGEFMSFNTDYWQPYAGFKAQALRLEADGKKLSDVRVRLEGKPGQGTVTLHPWKQRFSADSALHHMKTFIRDKIKDGTYDPDKDLVLMPWNKSCGTIELNKAIAQELGARRNATVFHIIAGYQAHFYAVGDRIMVDKQDAIITEITLNSRYVGKEPMVESTTLDRWGVEHGERKVRELSDEDIFAHMENLLVEDKVNQASHVIKYKIVDMGDDDGEEQTGSISTAGELNNSAFGYAITVHKAQGSECRRVFFLTAHCHSKMLTRELVYTAITRAKEELYVLCSPLMLETAHNRPQIKGNSLQEKLQFFKQRKAEFLAKRESINEWEEEE